MSLQEIQKLLKSPADTMVLCNNKIKGIKSKNGDPTSNEAKRIILDDYDMYSGDVIPGKKSKHYPDYAEVKDPYGYKDDEPDVFVPFYINNNAQLLHIKPPIKCDSNYNYFPELIVSIQTIYKTMLNSHCLTKELVYEIMQYLPFTFPILVSCTSIFRGRSNWTHFTYPFTKSKGEIIDHMKQCGKIFDSMNDCSYIVEFYLMKDDVPIEYNGWSDGIYQKSISISYKYDMNTLQRIYNKPELICKDKTNTLNDIMRMNDVGGSFWFSIWLNKQNNAEWCQDTINNLDIFEDTINNFDFEIETEIGGSCGIKSRCWFQLNKNGLCALLRQKYLPMVVINVIIGPSLLRQTLEQIK
eukprot:440903_1